MRLDLYQAETERIAAEQTALLDEAREMLKGGRGLSALESNGVLHALQVLIEKSIGKAKQWLKGKGEPVPVSAYDAFAALARVGRSLPICNCFFDEETLKRQVLLRGRNAKAKL